MTVMISEYRLLSRVQPSGLHGAVGDWVEFNYASPDVQIFASSPSLDWCTITHSFRLFSKFLHWICVYDSVACLCPS